MNSLVEITRLVLEKLDIRTVILIGHSMGGLVALLFANTYPEKVKALTLKDFEDLMEEAGIYLLDIFGDYKLKKFHKTESERLIMIFK